MSRHIKLNCHITGHGIISFMLEIHDDTRLPTIIMQNGTDLTMQIRTELTGFHRDGDDVNATVEIEKMP